MLQNPHYYRIKWHLCLPGNNRRARVLRWAASLRREYELPDRVWGIGARSVDLFEDELASAQRPPPERAPRDRIYPPRMLTWSMAGGARLARDRSRDRPGHQQTPPAVPKSVTPRTPATERYRVSTPTPQAAPSARRSFAERTANQPQGAQQENRTCRLPHPTCGSHTRWPVARLSIVLRSIGGVMGIWVISNTRLTRCFVVTLPARARKSH